MCRRDDYPPFEERMLPGEKPYTPEELGTLHRLVEDAAAGDPGEAGEREAWLAYFVQRDVTTLGDEWPSYLVERWERNAIGEERFTGQTRVYHAIDPTPPASRSKGAHT